MKEQEPQPSDSRMSGLLCLSCRKCVEVEEHGETFSICQKLHWTDTNDAKHYSFERKHQCEDYIKA